MEFFFEIYSEETPAVMQLDAQQQLHVILKKFFENLTHQSVETFVTPQRLVGVVRGLSESTKEITEIIRGPKTTLTPEIIDRFCKTHHIKKEKLLSKDGYFYVEKKTQSIPTKTFIQNLIPFILESFHWPKVMRWPQSKIKWTRPIRSIMMVLNKEPITIEIPELGITTKDHTIGHRFLSPKPITPKTFDEYQTSLKEHFVILSHQERQNIIKENLQGAFLDEDLLIENAGLTEFPVVQKGNIDESFMKLPKEVLKTVMKKHQKYFFFENQPQFCAVCNILDKGIIKGYERVLRARLKDAQFFYDADVKIPLKNYNLSNIVFYKGLGSIQDKVNRLLGATKDSSEQAVIRLCKKDLLTQMVYEFPELQGIMGGIYAKAQKQPDAISEAIIDHVRLQPLTPLGAKVALLDRLDSLVGLIGSGVKMSGSKDPYGLRRHAITIIRIYEQFKEFEPLETLIIKTFKQFKKLPPNTCEIVEEFIYSRLKAYYHEDANYIHMALKKYPLHELKDQALKIKEFLHTQEGKVFLQAYKRLLGLLNVTKKTGEVLPSHASEIFLNEKLNMNINLKDLTLIGKNLETFFNEVTLNEGAAHMVQSRQNLLFLLKQKISTLGEFSLAL